MQAFGSVDVIFFGVLFSYTNCLSTFILYLVNDIFQKLIDNMMELEYLIYLLKKEES